METKRRSRRIGAKVGPGASAALLALCAFATPTAGLTANVGAAALNVETVAINVGPGDQYDAHLGGDLASYTDNLTIRYYDFFSGVETQVPSQPGETDFLSDVSDGRIAFSRNSSGSSRVLLFDVALGTTSELDPQPTSLRYDPAIGATTVAFIDLADATGELLASDLGGATVRITDDARYDQNPSVAPLGGLIAWESCATDPTECSIRQAAWNGSSWQVSNLTGDDADAEANPSSDGAIVVYDAERTDERDICWTPAGGGSETCLDLPGVQRDPSVSGGLIVFAGAAFGELAELWLYRIADNSLFKITSTPISESLSDIVVLADGRARVVWSSGDSGNRDVHAATIELPPVGPRYAFDGFRSPVDGLPTLNSMKAGAAVPVKFSLGGDHGLDIFAAGYPRSQVVACDSAAPVDGVEQTLSAGGSGLTYDASIDLYTYVWKTDKSWAGTCRQLVLMLADGSTARANFKFK